MISRKIKPVADYRWSDWRGNSAFISRGRDQRTKLLLDAVRIARRAKPARELGWHRGVPNTHSVPGVVLHVEGGRAFDRHARRLIKDGLLRMERRSIKRAFNFDGGNIIRWSILVPTEKGFTEADRILSK